MRRQVEELFHVVADLPPHARSQYFEQNKIDLNTRKEVESLLAFDSGCTGSLDGDIGLIALNALARVEPETLLCGPYRLGDLLGSGGMGSVYYAERVDGEVAHRVAVKLLRPGGDDSDVRRRFLAERQILARLSHPNIARLLDAGHREDGQPYLVMEYVEGKPIDVHTAGFTVPQKIAMVLKVCAAVSYLHRNLVVHRDLKPANILVTHDGEPKLLDFGIARLLDLTTNVTVTGMRMLTPDYASPEQVVGGAITTATDIYSLGAVLYRLLTGASPHHFDQASAGSLALAISTGRIVPPSKRTPGLSSDLEMVVMKALRKEPEERYESVDALASDLRACLEWRPVQARSGDVWYRTRRWLRRHSAYAGASLLVIASLTGGLCVANHQRALAERRFGQLRQLSDRVIDLDRAIRTLPGSTEARKRLVAASLEYLEGLSQEAPGNLELAQEISDGYWRLGRIQGVNAEFNLGDPIRAEETLKKADILMDTVLASHPEDAGALFRSAVIAHDRMILADTEERRDDVLVHAHKAAGRIAKFLAHRNARTPVRMPGFLRPGNAEPSELTGAASLYANIGLAYINLHLYSEGALYARKAVDLTQALPSAQDVAGKGLSILANALRYQGDLDSALATIRKARQLAASSSYPNETARLFNLYGVLLREGRILGEEGAVNLGRADEAIQVLQEALNLTEEAAQNDPHDSASRSRVVTVSRELGDILRDREPRRALAVYELGLRRLAEVPDSVKTRRDRAQLLANSSYTLRHLGRASEAAARIQTALAILKQAGDYPAERIRLGSYPYAVITALADHQSAIGHSRSALSDYDDLFKRVLASEPRPETILTDAVGISRLYSALARLNRRTGQNDLAIAFEIRRSSLWHGWEAKLPKNGFIRRQLANVTK